MSTKVLYRSFAGGEITGELAGRVDLTKFQTGLSLCRNFIVLPHGPVARRPGFEFVNEAKDSTHAVRLMPFSFSTEQTAVIEFGHQYVRFHVNGGTLLEDSVAISSIAGSTVNTTAAHGYSTGDWAFIGTRYHKVTVVDADTFTTTDLWGVATTASGTTAARVYTLTTSYDSDDLFDLHFTQSSDVITIAHPNYPAAELSRLGAASWSLTNISFAAPAGAPTGVAVAPTIPQNQNLSPQRYVVTAVGRDGTTESLPSAPVGTTNNLSLAGNFNTVIWNSVSGAPRYNVYKLRGGVYGYIGQVPAATGGAPKTVTEVRMTDVTFYNPIGGPLIEVRTAKIQVTTSAAHGYIVGDRPLLENTGVPSVDGVWQITDVPSATTFKFAQARKWTLNTYAPAPYVLSTTGQVSIPALSLSDDNVLADTSQSPPEDLIALNAESGDYPATVTYHEQRRWFAGTNGKPQVVWATRTGTESNLTSSIPSRAADGMELRVAAMQNNQVRHLVALTDLIALTAAGEFRIGADGDSAITPTSVSIKPQGYSGASNVQPVVTAGSLLYVQAQGSRIRELGYNWESNSYRTLDVSIMAPHRFNGYGITQLAYTRAPDQILWAVRSDGTLLAMTYVPDQQVFAWHAHDTDGAVESVCVVAEDNEDALYVVVKRTVDGRDVRYVERLRTRIFTQMADAFFVDSGLTYDGTPITTLGGLWHLEGKEVDILTDGAVHPKRTVVDGAIALDYEASVVHVGLPIISDMRTLPLAVEGAQAAGQGTVKNVNKVHLRVSQSSIVKAGPDFVRLREFPARAVTDPYGSPPALRDGELSMAIDPSWNQDGALCVRQDLPLPLSLLSMSLEVTTGG